MSNESNAKPSNSELPDSTNSQPEGDRPMDDVELENFAGGGWQGHSGPPPKPRRPRR